LIAKLKAYMTILKGNLLVLFLSKLISLSSQGLMLIGFSVVVVFDMDKLSTETER